MISKVLKSLTAFVVCFALLICFFSVDAFAVQETEVLNLRVENRLTAAPTSLDSTDTDLIHVITKGVINCDAAIDISAFKINYYNSQKLVNILSYEIPECFHFRNFEYLLSGSYITHIKPQYFYTKAEYNVMLEECESIAAKMLDGINDNATLGTKEKLLLLHDRISLWCEYDTRATIPPISHTMYGVFANRIGVCQGYTLAYKYLLNKLGIETYTCSSAQLNHVWNIVYVDGQKYHVDITWDDPIPDAYGSVQHKNFLVSSQGIINTGHYFTTSEGSFTDYDRSPVSTIYDDYFWQDINTAFVLLNGEIYYIENSEEKPNVYIKRYSDNQVVYSFGERWMIDEKRYYVGTYSYLATDGTNLLFSKSDGIYAINPITRETTRVVQISTSSGYNVYGFKYHNDMIYYQLATSPNLDNLSCYSTTYYTPTQLKAGNVNLDEYGNINAEDVVILARALAGWNVNCNKNGLDLNGDGIANLADLVHLARFVAGWENIVLH